MRAITAPATAEAAKWTGWATALKPAWEPIVLAMKPMDGTLAHNALTWGVAGMNIDAARIGENPGYKYNADRNGTTFHGKQGERIKQSAAKKGSQFIESTKGRWPANLLLDEEAAAQLDEQTGTLTSGSNNVRTKPGDGYHGGMGKAGDVQVSLRRQRRGQPVLLLRQGDQEGARAGQRPSHGQAPGPDEVSAHAAFDPGRRRDSGPLRRQRHHAVGRPATRPPLHRRRVDRTQLRDRQVSP